MLERRSKNGMRLFPVMVRACDWKIVSWLEPIQIRPTGARPLADFRGNRRDAEMAAIAEESGAFSTQRRRLCGSPDGPPYPPPTPYPTRRLHRPRRGSERPPLRARPGRHRCDLRPAWCGGIGKTILALKLAEELKPLYPDAQIYLDLKGVNPQPLTTAQAMAHVIRSFHPEARLPESEAELAGLYRSVLDEKRVLLLMDNAARKRAGGTADSSIRLPAAGDLEVPLYPSRSGLPGSGRDVWRTPKSLLLKIAPRIGNEPTPSLDSAADCLSPFVLRAARSPNDRTSPFRLRSPLQGRKGTVEPSRPPQDELRVAERRPETPLAPARVSLTPSMLGPRRLFGNWRRRLPRSSGSWSGAVSVEWDEHGRAIPSARLGSQVRRKWD